MGNILTLNKLANMSADEVKHCGIDEIKILSDQANEELDAAKRNVNLIHEALMLKCNVSTINETGTTHVESGDYDIAIAIPKRVSWDNEMLKTVFENIAGAEKYIKFALNVTESDFSKAPNAIRDQLAQARTVLAGKPTFSITHRG